MVSRIIVDVKNKKVLKNMPQDHGDPWPMILKLVKAGINHKLKGHILEIEHNDEQKIKKILNIQ